MFPILANESALLDIMKKVIAKIGTIRSDCRGTSAIEFAFFAGLLSLGLLNITDVSIYIYQRMELENAAEMAAQAAWKTCDPFKGYVPATTNCPGLTTAITNALQSTSLGTNVSLQSGSPAEGYYCVNSSGSLQYVSAVSSKPADCTVAGMSSLQPTDYIQITASFSYVPLFSGITVAGAFATPITKTTMMRLN
ncbi:MAG TPA: TadE/TadG family type IV pilus assembly protein [Pseudolabrys sp.]|jgi:Flp pilus assembly protein TadG